MRPRFRAPPLDGWELIALHNAGHLLTVQRLLALSVPAELSRERDRFILLGARLHPDFETARLCWLDSRPWVRRLRRRLGEIARVGLPVFIDLGTYDGALQGALLLHLGRVPSRSTVARALERTELAVVRQGQVSMQPGAPTTRRPGDPMAMWSDPRGV